MRELNTCNAVLSPKGWAKSRLWSKVSGGGGGGPVGEGGVVGGVGVVGRSVGIEICSLCLISSSAVMRYSGLPNI